MSITNISALRKDLFNKIENVIEFNDVITVSTKKGMQLLFLKMIIMP